MTGLYQFLSGLLTHEEGWAFGFADLRGLLPAKYEKTPYAVSLLKKLDDSVLDGVISKGPTAEYRALYYRVNEELHSSLRKVEAYLTGRGLNALALLPTVTDQELSETDRENLSYPVSHKMAATRAGLGWVGKTDLLVSFPFGPRVRLGTLLTGLELEAVKAPQETSLCGDCEVCVKVCPAHASNGGLWDIHTYRDNYYNARKCRAHCREITMKNLGENESLCGVCVAVCPQGRKS